MDVLALEICQVGRQQSTIPVEVALVSFDQAGTENGGLGQQRRHDSRGISAEIGASG
jgi:hypothetical protein